MSRSLFAALTVLSAVAFASGQMSFPAIQVLLPDGAEIVEAVDLTSVSAKPRTIVLWMLYPQRFLDDRENRNQEGGYCSDISRGDFGKYREGPTRLSLIDTKQARVLNTIDLRAGCDSCGDSFQVPVCILSSRSGPAGKPNLDLKDLTGEGLKADFALTMFEAFDLVATGAFGYDPTSDRVVQYPVELKACGCCGRRKFSLGRLFGLGSGDSSGRRGTAMIIHISWKFHLTAYGASSSRSRG